MKSLTVNGSHVGIADRDILVDTCADIITFYKNDKNLETKIHDLK